MNEINDAYAFLQYLVEDYVQSPVQENCDIGCRCTHAGDGGCVGFPVGCMAATVEQGLGYVY